jgi:hypothetical protein
MTFTAPGTLGPGANATLAGAGPPFAGAGVPPAWVLPPYTMQPHGTNQSVGATVSPVTYHFRSLGVGSVARINVSVLTSSGNIAVAVYAGGPGAASPGALLQTSGSIPCPASGQAFIALGGPVAVDTSCYLSIGMDNTTAKFEGGPSSSLNGVGSMTAFAGFCYQDNHFPPPATAIPANVVKGGGIALFGQP